MKTEFKIQTRAYPVKLKDARNGGERLSDTIVLTKDQLQAGGLIGMTDEDIIYRIYNRQGYRVMEIGNPLKVEFTVDLEEMYTTRLREDITGREVIDLGETQEAEACDAE